MDDGAWLATPHAGPPLANYRGNRIHRTAKTTISSMARIFGARSSSLQDLQDGPTRCRRNSRCYLILAKHSFRRSSSERTCVSMASCNASVPLLDNSAEAFLSRFCFQSRIACLVALWASDVALRYAFVQASAIEQVLHSWAAAA